MSNSNKARSNWLTSAHFTVYYDVEKQAWTASCDLFPALMVLETSPAQALDAIIDYTEHRLQDD